jgi:hypothetical protein
MLNNIINDKPEQASLDLHNYLTQKMRDVAGLSAPAEVPADAEVAVPAVETGAEGAEAAAGDATGTE